MIPDPSRRDRMVAMYRRGMGTEVIAAEFSVKPKAIRSALTRAGVYQRQRLRPDAPATEAQKAALAEYVANGGGVSTWGRENGVNDGWTWQLWGKIKRDLGWQAS